MFRDNIDILVSAVIYLQTIGGRSSNFKKVAPFAQAAHALKISESDLQRALMLIKTGREAA
jgi:hypothetical protein